MSDQMLGVAAALILLGLLSVSVIILVGQKWVGPILIGFAAFGRLNFDLLSEKHGHFFENIAGWPLFVLASGALWVLVQRIQWRAWGQSNLISILLLGYIAVSIAGQDPLNSIVSFGGENVYEEKNDGGANFNHALSATLSYGVWLMSIWIVGTAELAPEI